MSDIAGEILSGIRAFAASRPRSLQREVGPSQLGSACDHCLTAALMGWDKVEQDAPWLPLIGTAVHSLLLDSGDVWRREDGWLCEHAVNVGELARSGVLSAVGGTADLYNARTGTVVDLKIVGATTLNEARRHGPSQQYATQVQLYGRGFMRAGMPVERVVIAYLPRNSMRLTDAVFVDRPYDAGVATAALERAQSLIAAAETFERVSVQARDVFIDALPRAAGCYDCARYPSIVQRPSELAGFATNHTKGSQDRG